MIGKLLDIYRDSFDITENYRINDVVYDAYGFCNITNSKYVLVEKAELWRALCYEHVFFKQSETVNVHDIKSFCRQTVEFIEPELVRKGKKCTEKDHMYSYVTGVFICEKGLTEELIRMIRKSRFFKNYMFSIRGYCELRLLVVDLETGTVAGNAAARDLIKDYKKLLY